MESYPEIVLLLTPSHKAFSGYDWKQPEVDNTPVNLSVLAFTSGHNIKRL